MKAITLAKPEERASLFRESADLRAFPADLIEKDFWVCWTLQTLFQLPGIAPHLLFKGGTTLSKAYNVIARFSEDIDISVARDFVLPDAPESVQDAASKTKQKKAIENLKAAFEAKVQTVIFPTLNAAIRADLGEEGWQLKIDNRDKATLLFTYPEGIGKRSAYNASEVRIEMGGRSDTWPVENKDVIAYASDVASGLIDSVSVPVLSIDRTFWEKATILHNECYRPMEKERGDRISRHYYDLVQIAQHSVYGIRSLNNRDLLRRVVEHKTLYYADNWSRYDECLAERFRLVPEMTVISGLRSDYAKMRDMFFVVPPDFDSILDDLRNLEREINTTQ